jgi:serine O-acetyltransferase
LTIWHWGPIIINPLVRIGDNCTLYPGVLIGHKYEGALAPQIGNNVFIGSGAKIIGAITIGSNVTIAPNTVVTKDIPDNCTVGGIPAKIIKRNEFQ